MLCCEAAPEAYVVKESSADEMAAPADSLPIASWETWASRTQILDSQKLWDNICYLKLLGFEEICYST